MRAWKALLSYIHAHSLSGGFCSIIEWDLLIEYVYWSKVAEIDSNQIFLSFVWYCIVCYNFKAQKNNIKRADRLKYLNLPN